MVFIRFVSQIHEGAVGAVLLGRAEFLSGNRHDTFAIFAGALGNQLLDPCGKCAQRRRVEKSYFVAFSKRQLRQRGAEHQAGILRLRHAAGARFAHMARAF